MLTMTINLNGDGCWPDLVDKEVIHLANDAPPIQVAALEAGMVKGHPSVSFRFDLPDGQVLIAETSARLFVIAARAIEGRWPDLFDGE